jgi:hypothetical protein
MSLMAQLASRQQLGYGQAVTSSEMAVTLGLAMGPMVATVPRKSGDFMSWGWVNTSDVARALQGFDLFLSQWVCLKMVRICLIKCGH